MEQAEGTMEVMVVRILTLIEMIPLGLGLNRIKLDTSIDSSVSYSRWSVEVSQVLFLFFPPWKFLGS